jgi:hypothetical protein
MPNPCQRRSGENEPAGTSSLPTCTALPGKVLSLFFVLNSPKLGKKEYESNVSFQDRLKQKYKNE